MYILYVCVNYGVYYLCECVMFIIMQILFVHYGYNVCTLCAYFIFFFVHVMCVLCVCDMYLM